jgi:hypothetical protein
MRQGLLTVVPDIAARARLALPPEHRVAAVRAGAGWDEGIEFWLIEGPHMPEVPSGQTPPRVALALTISRPPEAETPIALTARWVGREFDAFGEWTCGEWPDFEAFQQAYA